MPSVGVEAVRYTLILLSAGTLIGGLMVIYAGRFVKADFERAQAQMAAAQRA